MVYNAARKKEAGEPFVKEAAMVKLYTSQARRLARDDIPRDQRPPEIESPLAKTALAEHAAERERTRDKNV